jgi:histidinol-phosphate/aromatic aminotransferase/cobyric acid decarboxylase-like protein
MLQEHLDWAMRTSPPTHAEGLRRTIARVRGVEPDCVLPGAGSSQLIFLALRHWLSPASRVLILDPTYGEYAHVLDKIIGCRVERLALAREGGYRLDPERLARKLREGFDLFVWVNPNNPTGRHLPRSEAAAVLAEASPVTRVWVDETYVEYAGPDQSLESFAVRSENVVVCKSLSKVCALSGLRAGYLCGPRHLFEDLRALTPPWSISLPAQMAAILALRDPEYYAARYRETHALREQLTNALAEIGIHEIVPGVGNFIMFHLAADGPDAATVVRECRQRGLFLRDFAGMQASLGRHALRIAVKDAATNRRMLGILRTVLGGGEAGDEVAARSSQAEEPGALTLVEA